MKHIIKYFVLLCFGGTIYYWVEMISRGYSHWSMFLTGGLCFILMGLINEVTPKMALILQMLLSVLIVTTVEFIVGCIVNLWLCWNVWDYSNRFGNVLGQICVRGSCYWFGLSPPAIISDDYLRYWLFNKEKPHYKLF